SHEAMNRKRSLERYPLAPQCECPERATTNCRNKPTMQRDHAANGTMTLTERRPNLMQRLSRLPTTPQLALLHRGKPKPLTWPHASPPLQRKSIRWCCIDLLRPPR